MFIWLKRCEMSGSKWFCFVILILVHTGCDPAYHKKFVLLPVNEEQTKEKTNEIKNICRKYYGEVSLINDSQFTCGAISDSTFDKEYKWIGFNTKITNDTIKIDLYQGMTRKPSIVCEDIEQDLLDIKNGTGRPNNR